MTRGVIGRASLPYRWRCLRARDSPSWQAGAGALPGGACRLLLEGRRKEGVPNWVRFAKAHIYLNKQYIVKKGLAPAAKIT